MLRVGQFESELSADAAKGYFTFGESVKLEDDFIRIGSAVFRQEGDSAGGAFAGAENHLLEVELKHAGRVDGLADAGHVKLLEAVVGQRERVGFGVHAGSVHKTGAEIDQRRGKVQVGLDGNTVQVYVVNRTVLDFEYQIGDG